MYKGTNIITRAQHAASLRLKMKLRVRALAMRLRKAKLRVKRLELMLLRAQSAEHEKCDHEFVRDDFGPRDNGVFSYRCRKCGRDDGI